MLGFGHECGAKTARTAHRKKGGLFRSGEFLREPSCRVIGALSCVCMLLGYTPDGPIAVLEAGERWARGHRSRTRMGFVKRLGWMMGLWALFDGVDGDVVAVC